MIRIPMVLLGFGTVGSGVYDIVTQNKDTLAHEGVEFSLEKILVKSMNEPNVLACEDKSLFTTDFADIEKLDVKLAVECMGGVNPALSFINSCLGRGIPVVTSNKEVMAKHYTELMGLAEENKTGLFFEAAVGGGIPVIRALTDSMQGNDITEIMGIINGTTNYILTQMSECDQDYSDALSEAQARGYAEANPEADVEGYDAAYKLSLLCTLAFHAHVPVEKIQREGIARITALDIESAKDLGYQVKLLAIGKRLADGSVEARVHPTMLPVSHPLAKVNGVFNAVFLKGHAVDDIMLYGRGAGKMPTASAVVSDMVMAARGSVVDRYFLPAVSKEQAELCADYHTEFFITLRAEDQPGVLAKVAGIFGQHGVSLLSVMQKDRGEAMVPLAFVTHRASAQAVQSAIRQIENLEEVAEVINVIQVEGYQL